MRQIIRFINDLYDRYHIALDKPTDDGQADYEPDIVVSESFI